MSDLCGVHAQLMSSAELALLARVEGLQPDSLRDALWKERSLAKRAHHDRTLRDSDSSLEGRCRS